MVRKEILKDLLTDPEWQERLSKVRTLQEFQAIVGEYTRLKGWEVKRI